MLCPPHSNDPVVMNWLQRHRGPVSFVLHIIGIPPTILGVLLIPVYVMQLSVPVFLLSFSLFFGGYAIQFLGHLLEGSEPGEITLLRKWLSRRFPTTFSAPKPRQIVS
jgi:hypothetical protein